MQENPDTTLMDLIQKLELPISESRLSRIVRKLGFRMNMEEFIAVLAEWLRHRYRMTIWKQWKRANTKMRNPRKLGLEKEKAEQAASTSHGPFWATRHSTVNFAITNRRLKAAGCYDIEAAYNQMH